ncbi:predicted protein [Histoplasma capsulatum var. duboisii H88]|uniref:Predicted protein n=1 Tax=Ajellomyces capsulatus (strain H88) TaxID=544711 RepID=F0UD50_AJEC8|nr:predicted protein [Histoplasma capsulatum var. duboisii H88]
MFDAMFLVQMQRTGNSPGQSTEGQHRPCIASSANGPPPDPTLISGSSSTNLKTVDPSCEITASRVQQRNNGEGGDVLYICCRSGKAILHLKPRATKKNEVKTRQNMSKEEPKRLTLRLKAGGNE